MFVDTGFFPKSILAFFSRPYLSNGLATSMVVVRPFVCH